jgi:catechol 2,3-dioxygenase-like lactoylglutathione lyase family enzyme
MQPDRKYSVFMISNLNQIECITAFISDLNKARDFYVGIFGLKIIYEDPNCIVVKFENILLNLLKMSEAPELVTPQKIGQLSDGPHMMFTIKVADVDAICAQLKQHGIALLNGPMNRPWGRRTAAFSDPFGNAWEVAQELA